MAIARPSVTVNISRSPRIHAGELLPFTVTVRPAPNQPYLLTLWAEGEGTFLRSDVALNRVVMGGREFWGSLVGRNTETVDFLWDTGNVPPERYRLTVHVYTPNPPNRFDNVQDAVDAFQAGMAVLLSQTDLPPQVQVTAAATEPAPVTMRRADSPPTADQALWTIIRNSANALSYNNYDRFMGVVLCGEDDDVTGLTTRQAHEARDPIKHRLRLPFPDTDAYRQLKVATEVFVMLNCGVFTERARLRALDRDFGELEAERRRHYQALQPGDIENLWNQLLSSGTIGDQDRRGRPIRTLPYLAIIRRKLQDVAVVQPRAQRRERWLQEEEAAVQCLGILMSKLTHPCFLELIWSYWHEEGMLVQTMNAITWRFQNRRGPADRDPLALLEIDPLRPLNNFIWGYIQDEQHRLTVARRVYEYDHHYGLTLLGKAVPTVRGADSRTRFLEAFHYLLHRCSIFHKEDDDTTVVADGFPVLNALKEVHLLLTQGAHNQYGDLPWTARQEMLMQEWLLARPEMREFLPSRIMVDYPEPWMDRVETMKTLQGWTDTSVMHFRDLGVFGEQILLSIRFGAWPSIIESQHAANWARYWRPEIQGYIHGYRTVTGVDLMERVDITMPSVLLQQRLASPRAAGALPNVVLTPMPSRVSGQLPAPRTTR
jgi:hypothetical protein